MSHNKVAVSRRIRKIYDHNSSAPSESDTSGSVRPRPSGNRQRRSRYRNQGQRRNGGHPRGGNFTQSWNDCIEDLKLVAFFKAAAPSSQYVICAINQATRMDTALSSIENQERTIYFPPPREAAFRVVLEDIKNSNAKSPNKTSQDNHLMSTNRYNSLQLHDDDSDIEVDYKQTFTAEEYQVI